MNNKIIKTTLLSMLTLANTALLKSDNLHQNYYRDGQLSEDQINNELEAQEFDADNTGRNIRDRNDNHLTAQDQGSNFKDRDLASKVRASIMKEKNLSTIGQNVKVIANNGRIVLRGPVKTEQEKTIIVNKAMKIVGPTNVKNELEVVG